MPEYGFAIGCDKDEYENDPVGVETAVRRLLKFNYKQFVDFYTEQHGEAPFTDSPVRFMGPQPVPPVLTHQEDEISFAWYVNTDNPEQYDYLPLLEVD